MGAESKDWVVRLESLVQKPSPRVGQQKKQRVKQN
jgi:hypothetical protein